ncbi:MAG: hypothetical protein PVF17_00130 [Ignavibacteria bacterium]|jgi:hypothetical protein
MKLSDFKIGEIFYTPVSKWMCTDIGSRVVVAIDYYEKVKNSETTPPYSIVEYVFDECDMEVCFTSLEELNEAMN